MITRSLFSLVVLLFITASLGVAQRSPIGAGSLIVDGSFTLSTTERNDSRFTVLSVAPSVSFFVVEGLAVGAQTALSLFDTDDSQSFTVGIGPRLSYYFDLRAAPETDIRGTVLPYVTSSVSYRRTHATFDRFNPTTGSLEEDAATSRSLGFDLGLGATYMLHEAVGLYLQATYQYDKFLDDDFPDDLDASANTFGLFGGLTIFLP